MAGCLAHYLGASFKRDSLKMNAILESYASPMVFFFSVFGIAAEGIIYLNLFSSYLSPNKNSKHEGN